MLACFAIIKIKRLSQAFSKECVTKKVILYLKQSIYSDSFTILGLWVLGLAVSYINESQLQTYESKTPFLMTSLQYYCIPGLAEIKTYAQKMQDAQVTKSLHILWVVKRTVSLRRFV